MRNIPTDSSNIQLQKNQRTYSFDIKERVNGCKYLKITEKKAEGDIFKERKITIFEEDLPAFKSAFKKIYQDFLSQTSEKNYITKARKTHPHAYKKWTKSEENCLLLLKADGLNIAEIAEEMGRQAGGIRSRLKKLGLI